MVFFTSGTNVISLSFEDYEPYVNRSTTTQVGTQSSRILSTQEEKHGTVYGCIVLYTTRNPGRWFTIVFYSEYDRIRTIYAIQTAEIRWEYGRKTPARFTVEYGTNTAVYGQISVEHGRLLWRYSDLQRPVIFLQGIFISEMNVNSLSFEDYHPLVNRSPTTQVGTQSSKTLSIFISEMNVILLSF